MFLISLSLLFMILYLLIFFPVDRPWTHRELLLWHSCTWEKTQQFGAVIWHGLTVKVLKVHLESMIANPATEGTITIMGVNGTCWNLETLSTVAGDNRSRAFCLGHFHALPPS